jgi:hypothetical protein
MSFFGRSKNPLILIVADSAHPPFRDAVMTLSQAGAEVVAVRDVFSAMAYLAFFPTIRHVLVDVRDLDAHERAFIQLAPRYFREVHVCVADVAGASARLRLEDGPADLKSIDAFIASASPVSSEAAKFAPEKTWTDPATISTIDAPVAPPLTEPAARRPLSTDAASLDTGGGHPSLHEAVRRRMAGDEAAPVQRKPPTRTPPTSAPPAAPPQARPTVTPQELDALLAPNDPSNPEPPAGDGHKGRQR